MKKYSLFWFLLINIGISTNAIAVTSVWTGPGTDFDDDNNWSLGIPRDIAVFNSTGPTSISASNSVTLNSMVFNPGAAAYTITILETWNIQGAGVLNNSSNVQTWVISPLTAQVAFNNMSTAGNLSILNNQNLLFQDSSDAGQSIITNNGNVVFSDLANAGHSAILNAFGGDIVFEGSSTGGNATITNTGLGGGGVSFYDTSSAGNAVINNDSFTAFSDSSTAGHATIINASGALTTFSGASTGGSAAIINNAGGIFSVTDLSSTGMSIGSIAGEGSFLLGPKQLTVGSNNLDSNVSGVISGDGGSLVKVGTGTLSLTGVNTYSGGTTILGGTLEGNIVSLQGNILDNAALAFNQMTDGSFAGVISGTGTVVKQGSGALSLLGNNTYAGVTAVNEGSLYLSGTLTGDATIARGAVLSDNGSLGTVINNGTLIPGHSGVGSLNVSGYSGSGALNIHFDGALNTSLFVTGNADLTGGILNVAGSGFSTGRYNIISAGSLSGAFADVNTPASEFLTFGTQYTSTDAFLVVSTNTVSFASVAQSSNQQGVAAALDTTKAKAIGSFASTVSALYLLSPSQVQSAYAQIGGDSLASFQSVGLHTASLFTNQMNMRASPNGSINTADLMAPVQIVFNGDVSDLGSLKAPFLSPSGLWSRGIGLFDHIKADTVIGSPSADINTGGFQAGYDHALGDQFLVGASGGYSSTNITVSDRSSSGTSDAVQAGLYAGYTQAPWFFTGSLGYATASNSMARTISFPGIDEQANSTFRSHVYSASVEGGYAVDPYQNFSLEPLVSLQENHLQQNGYIETGAPGLDLATEDVTRNSITSSLGIRLSHVFCAETSHPYKLNMRTAWQHELADTDNVVSAEFVDAPGSNFTVQGTPQSRNAAAVGLGGSVNFYKNLRLFADYSMTIGSEETIQGIVGGLSVRW